ncbi:hypothetical protein [Lysobacter gummosus]
MNLSCRAAFHYRTTCVSPERAFTARYRRPVSPPRITALGSAPPHD